MRAISGPPWQPRASAWPGAGHPIVPVMIGDARLAVRMAARLGELGIFVTAFSFPVVPRGEARIRTQMSAAHSRADLDRAIAAFADGRARAWGARMKPRLMRALVKAKPEPGLWMEEVPVPEPQVGEVLVKVRRSAICGTDLHIWNWDSWARRTIPVPMVVGHEYVGEVYQLGAGVRGFDIGEAVTSEGHIVCGHCRNCRAGREHLCPNTLGVGVNRPGSFAEFVCVPAHNVYPIPANIPERVAAILDPYGNAIHTALTFDLVGEDVLITGAGPIGIMAVPIALRAAARGMWSSPMSTITAWRSRGGWGRRGRSMWRGKSSGR